MTLAIGGSSVPTRPSHGTLWVDVRDFGAKCDSGITDNAIPFQAAVDYLASILPPGDKHMGVVYIPSSLGTYITRNSVWIDYDNIEIQGDGWGSRVFCLTKNPAFIFGVSRSQPIDASGTRSTLKGDISYRPDSFRKLDASAVSGPSQKWGVRTNGKCVLQFHGTPLSAGVGSSAGILYSDQWTETSKLTIEFCVEAADGHLLPAGYSIFGVGKFASDPAPFVIGVGDNDRLLVAFKTSDLDFDQPVDVRQFWIDLSPFSPPYRIAIQLDLDNTLCSAFINGTQIELLNPDNMSATSAYPFVPNKGLKFIANDHYPFMIGASGLSAPYGGPTGCDIRIYGLRLSNTIRYQTNGVGRSQIRSDAPSSALNDAWAYFGQDANTIAFLAGTDNPATSGRVVTVQHGQTAVWPGTTMGMFMHTVGNPVSNSNNAIRNIMVQGSNAYGQVICLGAIFNFTIENVRALGGYHGVGSFAISSSYYIYLRGLNILEGSDAGYFGAIQLVTAPDHTEFSSCGRVAMRFVGCNADIHNVLVSGPLPITEGIIKARSYGYGGNYTFSNMVVDFEGYTISGAAIHCESHQQCAATSLMLKDIFFGTVGDSASLVRLKDVGLEDPSRAKCWLSIENMQAQTSSYAAAIDIDGPLWHGNVNGGSLTGPLFNHRKKWGAKSNIAIRDTRLVGPPRQYKWYEGSHVLDVRSPADGQYAEWRCVASGAYGTSNRPTWLGLNVMNASPNGIAAYFLTYGYIAVAIN